jgi:hypothetical protein
MSYIGGPLPGQEKEEVDLNEERLLGSRLSEQIQRGVAAIPRDKPWLNKVGKGLEWFADNSWHEGWIEAEEALIEQVGKHSPKIGVDPLIAQLAVGFMIPGPGGEAKAIKRTLKTPHLMKNVTEEMTQAVFNPNYKKLTKAEALKGLTGDLRKAAEKRWDQTNLLQAKAVERNKLLAKGLLEKQAYEKIHGPGTYKEFQLAEKKAGNILDKERIKKLVQRDKEARKASKEIVVRDLTEPRSQFKDMKIQPEGARHHKSGINTSYPIYYNLPYKDAQKLRKYAKTFDAEFGDVLNNLIDVPGTVKHELGNIHNAKLHVWLKKHGLDTPPNISPDAPVEVRMRVMQNYIVDLRRQAIKLKELMGGPRGTANVEDLTFIKPPLTKKDLGIK